jgi:hypothetical protein
MCPLTRLEASVGRFETFYRNRAMTFGTASEFSRSVSFKRLDLLEGLLEKALLAGERYVERFAQLAALARAIEGIDLASPDRAALVSIFEDVARNAQADAQLEVELFQGMLAGQLMKRQVQQERGEGQGDIIAPSGDMKH